MTLFADRDERILENLRIINSRFLRKKKEPVRGERVTLPGGSMATIGFAPSNSSSYSKGKADFTLPGVNDLDFIQSVLDRFDATFGGIGLLIWLFEGIVRQSMAGKTTHGLRFKGPTAMRGMEDFATTIVCDNTTGPSAANLALIHTFGQPCSISDLQVSSFSIGTNPFDLIKTTHAATLERLLLSDSPRDGLVVAGGQAPTTLLHVWVDGAEQDGISLSSSAVEAFGCKAEQCFRHGFYASSSTGALVGCTSAGNAENGFNLLSYNGRLVGCHSEGDELDGIYAEGCEEYQFVDSRVLSCGRHGMHLVDCSNGQVHDNIVSDASGEVDDTYDCIALEGDSNGNSVQSNRVFAGGYVPRYGIHVIDSTCDNNVVNANVAGPVADFGTGDYNDGGTGTQGTNFSV